MGLKTGGESLRSGLAYGSQNMWGDLPAPTEAN